MGKKMENKMLKAIDGMITRLSKMEDFVLDQAPDVIKEMIAEARVKSILNIGASFLATAVLTYISYNAFGSMLEADRHDGTGYGVLSFFSGISALIMSITVYANIDSAITVFMAPKVYIIERLTDLIKSKGE